MGMKFSPASAARRLLGLALFLAGLAGLAYTGYALRLKLAESAARAELHAPPSATQGQLSEPWEKQTFESLSALRAALASFKNETGRYPKSLDALVPRHIAALPEIKTTEQDKPSAAVRYAPSQTLITNAGGWAYVNDPSDKNFGALAVNSITRPGGGSQWSEM